MIHVRGIKDKDDADIGYVTIGEHSCICQFLQQCALAVKHTVFVCAICTPKISLISLRRCAKERNQYSQADAEHGVTSGSHVAFPYPPSGYLGIHCWV